MGRSPGKLWGRRARGGGGISSPLVSSAGVRGLVEDFVLFLFLMKIVASCPSLEQVLYTIRKHLSEAARLPVPRQRSGARVFSSRWSWPLDSLFFFLDLDVMKW